LLLPVLLLAQGGPKPVDLIQQGFAAETSGNWQSAASYYREAVTADPKLGEANFRLGRLLIEHDSFTAGDSFLEVAKTCKFVPTGVMIDITIGIPPHFEAGKTYKYDLFQVSRWLGLGYYKAGNYSSSIENYLKAVELKPKLADVRVELANVYFANGSDDEATEQDSIALALDVKNIEAQMVHGRLHARRREFDQARETYHSVIVQDPTHAEAYSALAELFKSSAPDSAIYYYRKYLELQPEDATANFNLSGLYYNQSQKEPADLPPKPDTKDTVVLKAYANTHDSLVALHHAAESESAFVYVGKAIRLGFSREDIYDFYVKVAQAANKRGASITALRTVLANDPKDALKWALLGQIYADSAITKAVVVDTAALRQSIDCYKQATTLDSTMRRRTYAWIGAQYYKQKQYDSAIAYYTRVITLDAKSASAYTNRGYAYLQIQQKGLGVADLEKGLVLDPKMISVRVYLMAIYYQDKQYDEAYDHAKAILEIDPNNEQAKAIKKNIDLIRNPPKPEE
jgi:protein O-GlcNAc transferase